MTASPDQVQARLDLLDIMFPLVPKQDTAKEFTAIWRGALTYLSGMHASCAIPGSFDQIDFSGALLALKRGFAVLRDSWVPQYQNDRYVVLQTGYPAGIAVNANTAAATGLQAGMPTVFEPYLMISHGLHRITFEGKQVLAPCFRPWEPGVDDLLADDWIVQGMPGRAMEPDKPEPVDAVTLSDQFKQVRE